MEKKPSMESPKRKTLVQLQAETTVRDPAAHSKHQITELDKTAQRSLAKRKACAEQIEADKKELAHIEEQIQSIQLRYETLCKHLSDTRQKRELVIQTLESCKTEEKTIMTTTQGIVHARRMDDAKLSREMASSILQQHRGFSVGPETTFHQTRHGTKTSDSPTLAFPEIKSKSATR